MRLHQKFRRTKIKTLKMILLGISTYGVILKHPCVCCVWQSVSLEIQILEVEGNLHTTFDPASCRREAGQMTLSFTKDQASGHILITSSKGETDIRVSSERTDSS